MEETVCIPGAVALKDFHKDRMGDMYVKVDKETIGGALSEDSCLIL